MLLKEELLGKKTVAIGGHVRPDGDCVGSTLAVYNYIRECFPDMDVTLYLEPIPNKFKFLRGAEDICSDETVEKEFDLFIALDCGDGSRLGPWETCFQNAKHTICIDHHVSNQSFAEKNYIVPDASSTCELVYDVLEENEISYHIAQCLYTGIVHDTGVFQYSCTSKKTMEIAGTLMEKGIPYSQIIDKTYYEKTIEQNRVLGQALLNCRVYEEEQCIASVISKEEMERFGVLPKHLDGIVNQLRITKDIDVAIFLYGLDEGSYKVSTRCKGETVDLSLLAMKYQGGGHKKAAGFTMEGSNPWDMIEQIVADIKEQVCKKS